MDVQDLEKKSHLLFPPQLSFQSSLKNPTFLQSVEQSTRTYSDSPSDQDELLDNILQSSIFPSSKKIRKFSTRKDRYNIIPNDIRLTLIDYVIHKRMKIKRAAAKLGINYSSAKSILQVFRKQGRADKKSSKKNKPRQTVIHQISPETSFINITYRTSSNSPRPLAVPEAPLFNPFSHAKHKESSFSSGNCLVEMGPLTNEKSKNADSFSPSISRKCSVDSQDNTEQSDNTTNQKCSPLSQDLQEIHIPELRETSSQHEIQFPLLQNQIDFANFTTQTALDANLPLSLLLSASSMLGINQSIENSMPLSNLQDKLSLLIALDRQQKLFGTLRLLNLQRNGLQLGQKVASSRYQGIPSSFSFGLQH